MNTTIKILGLKSNKSKSLRENARKALEINRYDAIIQDIYEVDEIIKHDINSIPAIIINNKVVVQGEVPSVGELIKLFKQYIA